MSTSDIRLNWHPQYQRHYRERYDASSGQWVFLDWPPPEQVASSLSSQNENSGYTVSAYQKIPSTPSVTESASYRSSRSDPRLYEQLDPSYFVRPRSFFAEGQVFAVLFTESAPPTSSDATSYNSAFSFVRYNEAAYTQIRRFVVVRQKREFCFACPIFTYSGQGTTKRGVRPDEHAVAYSYGSSPQLLPGEDGITKHPICVVMKDGERPLAPASRIYFGIHHPIQYNVKVKDIGYVHQDWLPTLLGYWHQQNSADTKQAAEITAEGAQDPDPDRPTTNIASEVSSQPSYLEPVNNPRAFFKKGRVFETSLPGPDGSPSRTARFAVIKPHSTHSVVLPLETRSDQDYSQHSEATSAYAAVVPTDSALVPPTRRTDLEADSLFVKVENANVSIDPRSRINLTTPTTVGHDIMVQNIGRVVGDSVGLLDKSYAQSLRHPYSVDENELD